MHRYVPSFACYLASYAVAQQSAKKRGAKTTLRHLKTHPPDIETGDDPLDQLGVHGAPAAPTPTTPLFRSSAALSHGIQKRPEQPETHLFSCSGGTENAKNISLNVRDFSTLREGGKELPAGLVQNHMRTMCCCKTRNTLDPPDTNDRSKEEQPWIRTYPMHAKFDTKIRPISCSRRAWHLF